MADTRYRGYKSYSYLTLADDFEAFDLDDELGRVPGYEIGLTEPEAERAGRLIIGWLVKHGYADADIQAVIGGNILRVLRQVW